MLFQILLSFILFSFFFYFSFYPLFLSFIFFSLLLSLLFFPFVLSVRSFVLLLSFKTFNFSSRGRVIYIAAIVQRSLPHLSNIYCGTCHIIFATPAPHLPLRSSLKLALSLVYLQSVIDSTSIIRLSFFMPFFCICYKILSQKHNLLSFRKMAKWTGKLVVPKISEQMRGFSYYI